MQRNVAQIILYYFIKLYNSLLQSVCITHYHHLPRHLQRPSPPHIHHHRYRYRHHHHHRQLKENEIYEMLVCQGWD